MQDTKAVKAPGVAAEIDPIDFQTAFIIEKLGGLQATDFSRLRQSGLRLVVTPGTLRALMGVGDRGAVIANNVFLDDNGTIKPVTLDVLRGGRNARDVDVDAVKRTVRARLAKERGKGLRQPLLLVAMILIAMVLLNLCMANLVDMFLMHYRAA